MHVAGGPYVAEAHANGTLFKHGIGIYLAPEHAGGTKLYRSHAISETLWPDFLFGRGN